MTQFHVCHVLLRDLFCTIVPNVVKIGQTGVEIWQFFDFSEMPAAPSWVYRRSKFVELDRTRTVRERVVKEFAAASTTVSQVLARANVFTADSL